MQLGVTGECDGVVAMGNGVYVMVGGGMGAAVEGGESDARRKNYGNLEKGWQV